MQILVFKTSANPSALPLLNMCLENVKGVDDWSFDLEDIDNILRISAVGASAKEIEGVLQRAGYECTELPD